MKKKLLSVLLCLCMVCMLLPTPAMAAGTPTPISTLNELKDAFTNGGSYILTDDFSLGTRDALSLASGKPSLTLDGNGHTITYTSTYQYGAITNNGTLTLNNLTILGTNFGSEGRCIYNAGTLTMEKVTLKGANLTSSNSHGAGLYNDSGATAILTDCNIRDNTCYDNGGGFYNAGTLILENCAIVENTSQNYGGGGYNYGTLYMNNCTVANNQSDSEGSGIYQTNVKTAKTYLMNSTVTGNITLSYDGGGISIFGGGLYAVNSVFAFNYNNSSTLKLKDIDFRGGSGSFSLFYSCAYGSKGGSMIDKATFTGGKSLTTENTQESVTALFNAAESKVVDTNTYYRPAVTEFKKDGFTSYGVYLKAGSDLTSGGTTTYYDRNGSTVQMSYGSAETNLGDLTAADNEHAVTTYQDGTADRTGSVIGALSSPPTHKHTLCQTVGCMQDHNGDKSNTNDHDNVAFTEWTDTLAASQNGSGKTASNSLPKTAGNYYLTKDVKLDKCSWTVSTGTTVLCLNGHTIKTDNSYDAITVPSATFTLTDCKTGSKQGKITHDKGNNGRGVYVYSRGTFNMYGGSISGNTTTDGYSGGGVYAVGTFNMYGGSITGNTANGNGGGVYVDSGTFTMSGGSITGNIATGTDYYGGGVYLGGSFTVSGNVNITGNHKSGDANENNENNVYLCSGKNITIGTGGLTTGAKIGVTTFKDPTEGQPITIVGSNAEDGYEEYFTSDKEGCYPVYQGGMIVLYAGAPHKHPICGATCAGDSHGSEVWQAIRNAKELRDATAGSYYLTSNIRFSDNTWTPANGMKLCLNGYSITSADGGAVITINRGFTFTLTDCKRGDTVDYGKITHEGDKSGRGVEVKGTFHMYGGSITGNTVSDNNGGGVYVTGSGKFEMSDGSISDNTAERGNGGGVYMDGGEFTMSGGTIKENLATDPNRSYGEGGGVYINSGIFTMLGGSITGNQASEKGGGVCHRDGTFTVSGEVTVTGNKVSGTENNVYLFSDKSITIGNSGLDGAARIGVTKNPTVDNPIKIATNATRDLSFYKEIFTPDVSNKGYVITKDENNYLYLSAHQHSWTYALGTTTTANDTITATCNGCTANGGSNFDGGTLIVKAPTGTLTYDGTAKGATLDKDTGSWQGGDVTITYQVKTGEDTWKALAGNAKPTDAGTYIASIKAGTGESAVTASVEYTIAKKNLTAADFVFTAPSDLTYSGSKKQATVVATTGLTGVGGITVKYYDSKGTLLDAPTNVGTYTVKIAVAEGTNFTATTADLTDESNWKFSITQNTTPASAPTCTFSFDGANAGKLMGSTTAMEYSLNGGTSWTGCTEDMDLTVADIKADKDIKVRVKETANQVASNVQTIDITAGGAAPNAGKTNCPSLTGKGSLTGVNSTMEYKMDGNSTWTAIEGDTTTVENLEGGTYYVRYKATGTTLPSAEQTLAIAAYVAKSDKAITSFKIGEDVGVIDGNIITVTVPYGTTVTALAPTIVVSDLATVSPASGVATNFTNPVAYTVTAEDNSTQTYTVTVTVAPPKLLSVTAPSEQTLANFHATADSAKVELPTTVIITSESGATTLNCAWSCASYDKAPGATNTFHWTATTTGFDVNGQTVEGDVTITNRAAIQLAISAPTLSNPEKIYDGDTTVDGTVTAGTLSGVLAGDTVTASAASADYNSKDAGNRTITVSYTISGTDAWKYLAPAASTVSGKINPASVTLTGGISATDRAYNGQNTVTLTKGTLSFTGLVGSETLDVTIPAPGTITDVNVGDNKAVTYSVTLADGNNDGLAANYTLSGTLPAVTVDITKATYNGAKTASDSVFSGQTTAGKTLTLPALPAGASYAASGTVGGTTPELISGHSVSDGILTYSTSAQSDGTSATITIGVTGAQNYDDYSVTVTITASAKAPAGVAFVTLPTSKTYGDADYEVSASVTNAGTNGVWTWTSSDSTVMTVTKNAEDGAKATVHIVKAGDATITAAYESDTTKGTVTSGTITVGKATITVTAHNQSIYVGEAAPTLDASSYTVTGLVNGETLENQPTASYASEPDTSAAGTVTINVTGAVAPAGGNYNNIVYVPGTLTIFTRPSIGTYTPPTYKVESEVAEDADGSVSFSKSSATKGDSVTITVTPDRYYKVDGVTVKDSSGKEIAVTDNGDGTFTFQMPASKVTVEPVFSWDNPFTDVAEDTYYTPAVEWALKNELTSGTGDGTTFSPDAGCTRAQIMTFLWKAAGCPEPAGANSFTDVSADAYYAKAVAWAAEQGITSGTGDGKFSPDEVCSRSQSMTFLYHAAGSPEVADSISFSDVADGSYYADAVVWAAQNGVTSGTSATTFSPNAACTRAQIMTFLYRWMVK